MNRVPRVNMTGTGEVIFKCSNTAKGVAEAIAKRSRPTALCQEEVHNNAVQELKQQGLNDPSLFDIRGEYKFQLCKYCGQTFHWLAENDIGYVTFIVASSMREGSYPDTPLGDTKKQLKIYLESFPAGRRALQQKCRELEERHASKLKKKISPVKTAKLVDSNLPPHIVAKRLSKIASPSKVKPNVSVAVKSSSPSSDIEDAELVEIGKSMESTLDPEQSTSEKDQKCTQALSSPIKEPVTVKTWSQLRSNISVQPGMQTMLI